VLTAFGASAVTFMMVMYALEHRHAGFVIAFACGCALSSAYGFLAGTWPFGVVEAIWALIAINRYRTYRSARGSAEAAGPRSETLGSRVSAGGHSDDTDDGAGVAVGAGRQAEGAVVKRGADVER
jgi:hypothetical protein